MKEHMNAHLGLKPYKCEICFKGMFKLALDSGFPTLHFTSHTNLHFNLPLYKFNLPISFYPLLQRVRKSKSQKTAPKGNNRIRLKTVLFAKLNLRTVNVRIKINFNFTGSQRRKAV